jgi:hypothetical protein
VEVVDDQHLIRNWTGKLLKRRAAGWTISFEEREGYFTIPSPNVNYLIVKPSDERLLEDILAKNFTVPANTATLVGDDLSVASVKKYLEEEDQPYAPIFKTATAPSTRRNHTNMIKLLKAMPQAYDLLPLATAILIFIQSRANQREWKASTQLTKLASIQGALRLLPFYKKDAPSLILTSTIWKMAMRGAGYAANAEIPDQAPILEEHHMDAIIKDHAAGEINPIAALIEVAWLVAGRVGDVSQLAPNDISLDTKDIMMVRFRRGKTARRGQFSIAAPRPSLQTIRYLQSRQGELWLFPKAQTKDVKDHLRQHVKVSRIECRSIRRGRLQLLSVRGMSDEELLHISRHQTLSSLRRYLNFGMRSGENIRRAKRVQDVLKDWEPEETDEESEEDEETSNHSSTL